MMDYETYNYVGMHLLWWILWMVVILWIFVFPYDIPGQRSKKETPLDMLNKRFAKGEINKEEYQEKKALIED